MATSPRKKRSAATAPSLLAKSPTGISGLDEILGGGLPTGRPTLVCGSAGCGKSLFAAEFLIRGIVDHEEPGILMTFEETADDIRKNVSSLGFDLDRLIARKQLIIDHVRVERSEIEENGEYDLEGLFIRLGHAVDVTGAKRVVLDTIETLFAGLSNQAVLRSEIRRLFAWLKARGLTTVITGERGEGQLSRQGLEEYVSDCVILLDHRVTGQISTRRLRVVKYRGSTHGTNEYPFLIDEDGISVLPLTMSGMNDGVSSERISTGIPGLDEMLGGGLYRGSTVLLSGSAGTGKSSLGAHLADATCRKGERCMIFSFEESPAQILRNMRSIGLNLAPYVRRGLLEFHSTRPTVHGLEMHLVRMHKLIDRFRPDVVVVDPVSNLASAGTLDDSTSMLIRLIDFLRQRTVTALLISLTPAGKTREATDEAMSSLADTWCLLRDVEIGGERNRALYVLKARGMAHSNQVREFLITTRGVQLVPPYVGSAGGVLTGSARLSQEAREVAERQSTKHEMDRRRLALEHRRKAIDAQIETLRAELRAEEQETARMLATAQLRFRQDEAQAAVMARNRGLIAKK